MEKNCIDRKALRYNFLKKIIIRFDYDGMDDTELDQVIWMENGRTVTGTHAELMKKVPEYAELICAEEGERKDEA